MSVSSTPSDCHTRDATPWKELVGEIFPSPPPSLDLWISFRFQDCRGSWHPRSRGGLLIAFRDAFEIIIRIVFVNLEGISFLFECTILDCINQ